MRYLSSFGKPTFLLGVNYWSRAGGPRMWEAARFDERTVAGEIKKMRELGMNACRSFFFHQTFMPDPPRVDPAAMERMKVFMRGCEAAGLSVLPSLLVGHMSGENYDFPRQNGRRVYTDPEVLGWQRELAKAACGALRGSKALSAWVLSNEMPLWGGPGTVEEITAWCKTLVDEVRAASGGNVPVGTGDGYMNARGGQNGFDPDALAPIIDYVAPHAYFPDPDALRQSLFYEYCIRSLEHLGKPVLFEEFGCSSQQAGDEQQALLWRDIIHTSMGTGAAGALGWCMSDMDFPSEAPYSHHAFEVEFGVVRKDGSEKAVARELRAAGQLVERLPWAELDFPAPRAALLRPSYAETTYPFSGEDRTRMIHGLVQGYTMARKAGIEVRVLPETQPIDAFDLILVPSTQKLLAPTWERIARRAEAGAIVYWSYFGGDFDYHQGMWCHLFERLTGCRHTLRYGVPDLPADELALAGELPLRVRTTVGNSFQRAFLPIEPVTAQVIARDGAGRPALVRNALGKGAVYFLTYPLEFYLGEQADINGRDRSEALYLRLAAEAKIARGKAPSDPRVQVHTARAPKESLVWVMNRSWDTVETSVDAPGGEGPYAPKEARVLTIR